MLHSYQLKIGDLYKVPIGTVTMLVPNFFDKENYVLCYENLQLYLKLKLKVKQIYWILEFNQSQWLKPNVEFNAKKNRSRK